MKILHVMAGAPGGGAEAAMLNSVLALAEAGVQQHVVTRPSRQRVEALRDHRVGVDLAAFDKVWRAPTQLKIRHAEAMFQPDVIQFWMGRAAMFGAARWRERSLAWHGSIPKAGRFKHCGWHAAVTPEIADHLLRSGIDRARVALLRPYATVEDFAPINRAALGAPEDAPVVLALGRFTKKSGLDTLLDASAQLPGVHVWIAGEGPLEDDLKERAERLGVAARVRFVDEVQNRLALFAACDVVALPAYGESFNAAALQAWALSKPLIVADSAGHAGTVTHERDAIVAPREDAKALAAGVRRVLEDGGLARELVENGRRMYESSFTKQAFVRAAMQVYDRMRQPADALIAAQ